MSLNVNPNVMNEFTTVFEIGSGVNAIHAEATTNIVIGVIAFVVGAAGLISRMITKGRFPKKIFSSAFTVFWGVMWLLISTPSWRKATSRAERLLDLYDKGQCEVTEGVVRVLHEQPEEGHAPGDKISIERKEFEVDYFTITPGYNRTIAHGGVLKNGIYARLSHYNGTILKIEVKNIGGQQTN